MANLTRAQIEVVALVANGLSNKQIAHRLQVEEATVKSQIGQAIKRLGFSNRVQLAVWFVKQDLEVEPSRSTERGVALEREGLRAPSQQSPTRRSSCSGGCPGD